MRTFLFAKAKVIKPMLGYRLVLIHALKDEGDRLLHVDPADCHPSPPFTLPLIRVVSAPRGDEQVHGRQNLCGVGLPNSFFLLLGTIQTFVSCESPFQLAVVLIRLFFLLL